MTNMYSSYTILRKILEGTGITLGQSVDIGAMISDDNTKFTGFAGEWNTRAEALNELLRKVSYIKGRNIGWFVDNEDHLRIFYTDQPLVALSVELYNNPRLMSITFEENAENIVNDITIVNDQGASINLRDEESINGWTDYNTAYRWPGYGVQSKKFVEYGIDGEDIVTKVRQELETYSKPIFSVHLKLEGFVDICVGQPLYVKGYQKFADVVFIVNRVDIRGSASKIETEISATTDRTVMGSVGDYDAVKALAKQTSTNYAIYRGKVEDYYEGIYDSIAWVKLNEIDATIRLSSFGIISSGSIIGSPTYVWKTKDDKWVGIIFNYGNL